MSTVKIEWLFRANGRRPGDTEVVERTEYVDALVKQRRVRVLEESAPRPILGVFDPEVHPVLGDREIVRHLVTPIPAEPVTTEAASLSEAELIGLAVPKPAPKPRKPRTPKPPVE